MLRQWVYHGLVGGGAGSVALRLRIVIDPYRDDSGGPRTLAFDPAADLELLTVIDAILAMDGPWPTAGSVAAQRHAAAKMRAALARILDEGSSVYRVDIPGKRLARRTDATTAAAFDATAAAAARPAAGSAGDQIRTAWESIYALRPDPPKAYRAAISAVESAAHAVIEPTNPNVTMDTMLGQMRYNPGRFALAIPGRSGTGDVSPLIAMMELLWHGQTSRHGSQQPERRETRAEAEMAVQLAITPCALVHNWRGPPHTLRG